jgi:hypothetical protein
LICSALENRLINLGFQRSGVISHGMKRTENGRRAWQVTFSLGNRRFESQRIYVVRRDIENLVKLPQSFRKTTKKNVGKRVLAKQANIARVDLLGLVE